MTVRAGVIGTGMIGQDHLRRLTGVTTGVEVVAVTDLDGDRAAEAGRRTGARVVADGAALIADPEVDAVLVCSWGPTHAEHVLAAIAAGKPVFCEKPLATTAEDCLRIVEAEMAHGRRLVQVGFMRRYDHDYRQLKKAIDSGKIGTPLMVHCAHRNATVPESYHSAMAAQDTAVHEIDVLRWLLDDEITGVQVLTPRPTALRFEHLRDPQIMLFETAAGVRIDLEVFVNCQYGYDIQCEAVGERGAIRLPSRVVPDWRDRFGAAFDVEIQEWVDTIAAGGEVAGPSAWDGYAATSITDATVEALTSGRFTTVTMKDRPGFYAGGIR
ncbi:Gfo/Idh/MocA family protein [Amycolatopsis lurida]